MMNLCVFRLPKKAPCVEGATACRQENLDSRLNLFDLGVPFALVTRIMFSSPNRSCIKPDHASILSPRYKYENFPISLSLYCVPVYQVFFLRRILLTNMSGEALACCSSDMKQNNAKCLVFSFHRRKLYIYI